MTSSTLISLTLLAGLWPFHAPQVRTQAYTLPTWSYVQSRDRFTGQLACRVYEGPRGRPPVSYEGSAVTFRFLARMNTLRADYRLDGGQVRPWRDDLPALAEVGFTPDQGGLDNPTGGFVTLPARELAGVHTVTIRPTPRSRPIIFSIDGLPDAVEAARARGCSLAAIGG